MKSRIRISVGLLSILLVSLFWLGAKADEKNTQTLEVVEKFTASEVNMPEVSAKAFAIFDSGSGEVLVSKEPALVLPIASVTKLLTAAAVVKNYTGQETATITAFDLDALGQAGRLEVGNKYTYYELLFPLLLESSNDAAYVYERTTKGQIIKQMNKIVNDSGAQNTVLVDSSGLSDRNVSTVEDLVKIATNLYSTEPHLFDITRLSRRVGPYVGWSNNSPVFATDYLGGKHGFTETAGRTLVAFFAEGTPNQPGRVLGYVVLGSVNLSKDIDTLRSFVKDSLSD